MWFGKKREKKASPLLDAAARLISSRIVRLQERVVTRLQGWESRCSLLQKKILFGVFCGVSTLALLSILAGALTGKQPLTHKARAMPVGNMPPSAQPPPLLPFKDSTKVPR